MIPTLILAAGKSSRMLGGDKLLEYMGGEPLLQIMCERALSSGATYVTIPSLSHPRRFVLPQAVHAVEIEGNMSDSLRAGIAALPPAAIGVVILPADMPDITADDITDIKTRARQSGAPIVRASTQDGRPGHPAFFARSLFSEFATLSGDHGAAPICAAHEPQTVYVPLEGNRARLDLDTAEDWAAYRSRPIA